MAISRYDKYQTLDLWREICLEDIWHFNQITGENAPLWTRQVYVQPDRDVVARAMTDAWDTITRYLQFPLKPIYQYEDILLGSAYHIYSQQLTLQTSYLQAVGRRAATLIEADATVTYSDPQGIGTDTLATITVTTSANADEIEVFFRAADSASAEEYQVYPLTVSKSGNTATITGHRALFVKPGGVWSQPYVAPSYTDENSADTADPTDFVTLVDVYRVYPDADSAVELVGPNRYGCDCGETVCTACARILDPENAIIAVQPTSTTCCTYPDRVRVHYRAGYPLFRGEIDATLRTALVRLANTMMPRQPCPVENRYYDIFAADRTAANVVQPRNLNNPFGVLNGQLEAWKLIQSYARPIPADMSRRGARWRQW